MKAVVMAGNPVDGHVVTGPFDSRSDAVEWAQRHFDNDDWWTTDLSSPAGEPSDPLEEQRDLGDRSRAGDNFVFHVARAEALIARAGEAEGLRAVHLLAAASTHAQLAQAFAALVGV